MSDAFCSALSIEVGEALAGTAAGPTDRYLVLEHDGAWGPKGVEDSGLPDDLVAYLGELGRRFPRLRVQLSRRERGRDGALRVYFAETGSEPALYATVLADLGELPSLDLAGWLQGTAPAPGQRETAPLYLVCTHGKRDRCCALHGLPVYRALASRVGDRALQTTHLGGHRFAATLLTLPHGICYGRVLESEGDALIAATESERIYDLARVRGRTAFPPEPQAAEVLLREQTGDLDVHSIALRSVERLDVQHYRVRLTRDGREHSIELTRETLPAAPASCGAAPKPASRLVRSAARS